MLVQLVRHNGIDEIIEVLRSDLAVEIAIALDWESERCRFEQLEVTGEECYAPCIAFTNDCGRTFEFGPVTHEAFWITYRYLAIQSNFGFTAVEQEIEQMLKDASLDFVVELLKLHYAGEHRTIAKKLPQKNAFDDMGEQSDES